MARCLFYIFYEQRPTYAVDRYVPLLIKVLKTCSTELNRQTAPLLANAAQQQQQLQQQQQQQQQQLVMQQHGRRPHIYDAETDNSLFQVSTLKGHSSDARSRRSHDSGAAGLLHARVRLGAVVVPLPIANHGRQVAA